MKRLLLVAVLLLLGGPTLAKRAHHHSSSHGGGAAARKEAASHYRLGTEAAGREDYETAIKEFQAGYDAVPDPTFQYNLGQSYRLANKPEEAVAAFERYLGSSLSPPNREEVEGFVKDLRTQIKPPPKETPATEIAPTPTTFDTSNLPSEPAQPTTTEPTAPLPPVAPAVEEKASTFKKVHYLFVAVTVATLLAGAACGVAAQAYANNVVSNETMTGRMPTAYDAAAQAEYQHDRRLGQVSGGLSVTFFGIAGAAAITAGALYFLDSRRADAAHAAIVPVVSPNSAGVAAGWKF
jgi:hypothetical protein